MRNIIALFFIAPLTSISSAFATNSSNLSIIAEKAYIYAEKLRALVNEFANMKEFPSAAFREVVRPNADTLYSSAWVDLSKEPIVLSVPDTHVGACTDVFKFIGKRTTATKADNLLLSDHFGNCFGII